jgi:hypothetical protein
MTDSVESVLQKSRKEFEKCAIDKGYSRFDFNRGDLQAGWLFWQASRSALEPMLAEHVAAIPSRRWPVICRSRLQ